MSQINKYSVREIQYDSVSRLNSKDQALIPDYVLEVPFLLGKYQLNALFYTLDGIFLETKPNIQSYSVLGTNQGNSAVELAVDPVQDALDCGYLGDVQVGYQVTNNLFSPSHSLDSKAVLFVQEISADRTELRTTSLDISEENLQIFAQSLQDRFTSGPYFTGATLSFIDEALDVWCINVMTEVLDGQLVVTFKLYEPLPSSLDLKSRFFVLEQIGDLKKFEVIRTVEVLEDEDYTHNLKGPNFDVEVKTSNVGTVTDYLNYKQLFSYPSRNNNLGLYSIYKEKGVELCIDHSDFSNFIHFSSAAERLENFRYKLGLIQEYEQELETVDREAEKVRLSKLIQGIIDNFDHYDRYLYFENTETAWPKVTVDRPYKNANLEEADSWFRTMLQKAQEYDEYNADKLTNTIPRAIRSNSQNEPYVLFVDMIGHHFDEEWLYAKAVSARFDGDNRLDFGLSKDLVQEALQSFGIELQTTNQNLERIFDQCIPGEYYRKGSELSVKFFERATAANAVSGGTVLPFSGTLYDGEYSTRSGQVSGTTLDGEYAYRYGSLDTVIDAGNSGRVEDITEFQPMYVEDYRKEIYKRIYHNIPLLLKTKGTARGIRALINCFGIPDSILSVEVQGGAPVDRPVFFGPEYFTSSSVDRVRTENVGAEAPLMFVQETGQFISGTILSNFRNVQQRGKKYQKSTNSVSVGINLNKQFNFQVEEYLSSSGNFDYDNIIGDPRNTEENYGEAFTLLRTQILPELRDPQGKLQIRTPYAILRLVRYIDSVLFRTLGTFVAARDEFSVGAIVEDNILHRNRYKSVSPTAREIEELSETIQTVYIDGGEGGSLKVLRGGRPANKPILSQSFEIRATVSRSVLEFRELPTVNYVKENAISIGSGYETSTVFDDSPKYTGELLGTEVEITNGELNEGNIFKKGGSSLEQLDYQVDFRFLCLPAKPVDTVIHAIGQLLGRYFNVVVDNVDELSVSVNGNPLLSPEVVIGSSEDDIKFKLVCEQERQQGWIFSVNPLQKLTNNYIGLDLNPDSQAGQDLELEIYRATGQEAILLPNSSTDEVMEGSFGEKTEESANLFWEKTVLDNGFRTISARSLPLDARKVFTFSLDGEEVWPSPGDGEPLVNIDNCYRLVSEDLINYTFDGIRSLFPTHELYQIYVALFDEGQYELAVLDLETGIFRKWDDIQDTGTWALLRGYPDDWDAKSYVLSKYIQTDSSDNKIVGIILRDNVTGLEGFDQKVLIEPYMGTSYVFVKDLTDDLLFQMRIKEWSPENVSF